MEKFKNNKVFIISVIVVFVIGVVAVIYQKIRNENVGENLEISQYNLESVLESDESQEGVNSGDVSAQGSNDESNSNTSIDNNGTSQIYIHIIGEVKLQGIVILNEGARIIDAIEKAGGVTEYADLAKVNLAFKLSDGQKVYS